MSWCRIPVYWWIWLRHFAHLFGKAKVASSIIITWAIQSSRDLCREIFGDLTCLAWSASILNLTMHQIIPKIHDWLVQSERVEARFLFSAPGIGYSLSFQTSAFMRSILTWSIVNIFKFCLHISLYRQELLSQSSFHLSPTWPWASSWSWLLFGHNLEDPLSL